MAERQVNGVLLLDAEPWANGRKGRLCKASDYGKWQVGMPVKH